MLLGDREKHIETARAAIADGCGRCGAKLVPCSDCARMTTYSRFPPLAERIVDALAAIPPEIDEEMVERAWREFARAHLREGFSSLTIAGTPRYFRAMRAALEAAFTPPAQPGQREETTR